VGVAQEMQSQLAKNILVHEDGNYKGNADYPQAQVTLNGRPMSPQELVP